MSGTVGLSYCADMAATYTLTLKVHEQMGAEWKVPALFIANTILRILLAPVVARLVSANPFRPVMTLSALLQALLVCLLVVTPNINWILVEVALLGAVNSTVWPAASKAIPALAGEQGVVSSNSLLQTAYLIGGFIGPPLAGLLTGSAGWRFSLLFCVAIYAIVAATVLLIPASLGFSDTDQKREESSSALVFLKDRVLRIILLTTFSFFLLAGGINVAQVFLIKDVLGAGDSTYGLVASTWTIGMALGAAVAGRLLSTQRSLAWSVLWAAIVQALAIGLCSVAPNWGVVALLFATAGIGNGATNPAVSSLIHMRVPPVAQARVFTVVSATFSTLELGALALGGVAVTAFSPRGVYLVAGIFALLVALSGLTSLGRARHDLASLDSHTTDMGGVK
jgi:MFS family permease